MIDSYFEPDRGPEWVRTYLLDGSITFTDDRRILETWLVSGRYPLHAVATGTEEYNVLSKKGLPIKQLLLPKQVGLLRAGGSGCCISVFANAPHANAAKLFVEYLLSKPCAEITQAEFSVPVRNDVTPAPGIHPLGTLKGINKSPQEMHEKLPELIERWRDTFGV